MGRCKGPGNKYPIVFARQPVQPSLSQVKVASGYPGFLQGSQSVRQAVAAGSSRVQDVHLWPGFGNKSDAWRHWFTGAIGQVVENVLPEFREPLCQDIVDVKPGGGGVFEGFKTRPNSPGRRVYMRRAQHYSHRRSLRTREEKTSRILSQFLHYWMDVASSKVPRFRDMFAQLSL